MIVKCEYHDNVADVQDLAAPGARDAPVLFDRMAWFAALHTHCLAAMPPLVASAIGADGSGVRLVLARHGWRGAVALANYYSFSYRPIFAGAADDNARAALLEALARDLPRRTHRLVLAPVPEEDGSADLIADSFARAGWRVFRRHADVNHMLALDGRDFEAYWQGRPGQLRSTVRRKASKYDVAIRIATGFDPADWADYDRVYRASWKPEEGSTAFLRSIAMAEGAAGRLRIGLAHCDGRPVAAQFWTVEAGTAYIHKLAHDEAATAASPGTLLSAAMFQHVIDQDRAARIDFGTGDDGYKRDWMEQVRRREAIELIWPYHPFNAPFLARRLGSRLAAARRSD